MELPNHFNRFLTNISLDDTRRAKLEGAISNLQWFVENDVLGDLTTGKVYPQGSWAHKTVVRPIREEQEYDVDIVLPVDANRRPADKRDPDSFLSYVKSRLDTYDDYAGKVTRRARCVRITYSGLFHLDLVPLHAPNDPIAAGHVPNRSSGKWEPSNPAGYTKWLSEAHGGRARFMLQPATKAMKRWRDLRLGVDSAPKSIVLTTLLGLFNPGRVTQGEVRSQLNFATAPSLASFLVDSVTITYEKLAALRGRPVVPNPGLPDEDLARAWTNEAFSIFMGKLATLADRVNKAYAQRNEGYSINWWRDAFGDAFPVNP